MIARWGRGMLWEDDAHRRWNGDMHTRGHAQSPSRLQKLGAKAEELLEDPQLYQGIKYGFEMAVVLVLAGLIFAWIVWRAMQLGVPLVQYVKMMFGTAMHRIKVEVRKAQESV
ncbi:hypothetical protein FOA52_008127 [Chlamydomonas sp. UWO 241]|nr:hypothetical protein FOA52_008127 [Chlamydomonas sp. UWO 241]